jgi:hypothetical protein
MSAAVWGAAVGGLIALAANILAAVLTARSANRREVENRLYADRQVTYRGFYQLAEQRVKYLTGAAESVDVLDWEYEGGRGDLVATVTDRNEPGAEPRMLILGPGDAPGTTPDLTAAAAAIELVSSNRTRLLARGFLADLVVDTHQLAVVLGQNPNATDRDIALDAGAILATSQATLQALLQSMRRDLGAGD